MLNFMVQELNVGFIIGGYQHAYNFKKKQNLPLISGGVKPPQPFSGIEKNLEKSQLLTLTVVGIGSLHLLVNLHMIHKPFDSYFAKTNVCNII